MSREILRERHVVVQTALTPIVWGTTYFVAVEFLPTGRPMLAAAVRALPVGLVFVILGRTRPSGVWWWRAIVLGALNIGLFFGLLFVAAFRLAGGVAATIGAVQPLIAGGLAAVVVGERFTRRTALGGGLGVVGVALLVLRADVHLDTLGVLAALGATTSMAAGVVLTKKWGRPVGLIAFTGWQLTAGGILIVPVMIATEGLPNVLTGRNIAGFVWLSIVGTGLAYANWFRGIQTLPVTTASTLGLLSPLVATFVGWFALDQTLSPSQFAGALLVIAAVGSRSMPGTAYQRRVDRLVFDAPTTPNDSTDATIDLGASLIQQSQTNKGH